MEEEEERMKCLDTSVLIDITRDSQEAQRAAESALAEGAVTTELNAFELFSGAHHRGVPVRREMEAAGIALRGLDILPLTRAAALKGAAIVSLLRSRGQDMGALDILVAAITLAHGIDTIVTRDAAHFRRVPGLRVETY
jgi:tRNA(fMet)-specific endonuclease VapC